jgi:hypothetical protein
LTCELYRCVSLYADADYVMENMWVKGRRVGAAAEAPGVDMTFQAHYFTYMDFGFLATLWHYANVPDWFAVGNTHFNPFPGYGFATDAHAAPAAYPHPEPLKRDHMGLSWELLPAKQATSYHVFMHDNPDCFRSRDGHGWYEFVYKPLKAEPA